MVMIAYGKRISSTVDFLGKPTFENGKKGLYYKTMYVHFVNFGNFVYG
jgi:hypothetical protein